MKRRPWPIVILAVLQILCEPISNVFLNSWLSHLSPHLYLKWFFVHHCWWDLFYILILPPIMGLSIYIMKAWSYPVFVLGATWMLIENFLSMKDGYTLPISLSLSIYIGNLAFVGYFLIPSVKATFFNAKLRWWESKKRFIVNFSAKAQPVSSFYSQRDPHFDGKILNFSEGGLFFSENAGLQNMKKGQKVWIQFEDQEMRNYVLPLKIVFYRSSEWGIPGYGMQFLDLNEAESKLVIDLTKKLKKDRYPFRGGESGSWKDFKNWLGTLLKTGQGLIPQVSPSVSLTQKDAPADKEKQAHNSDQNPHSAA